MTTTRALALSVLPLLASMLSAQGGTFSTGPVSGPPPGTPVIVPATAPGPSLPSPVAGTDVRANQVLNGMQNETSLAVNPTNARNLVGVANDYRFGQVQTGWFTSLDGGGTWTTGTFGIDSGFSFSGDPAVAFDTQGVVHVVCMMYSGPGNVHKLKSFRSLDGGITWSTGVQIGAAVGYDKPQLEVDHGPTSPNRDHLLVAWNTFGAVGGGDNVVVSVSSNQGTSWSAPQVITAPQVAAISPDVAWGPNGEAYVLWADRGLFDVKFDRSLDNGVTWGVDKKIGDFTQVPSTLPGSGFRVFDIFALHADQSAGPFGGRIYVAYHTWDATSRADVLVTTSSDQGTTWSPPVKITSDGVEPNDQLFPGVVVDRQGSVNVTFYDQRNDTADHLLWTWVARSANGGTTWTDHAISDLGWNCTLTEMGGFFIGDYIDIDAEPQGGLRPMWCDGRTGTQDVYVDTVNLQLFTDVQAVSVATGGAVAFSIRPGPNLAGSTYVLVATGSGTTPGVPLGGGLVVPINPDFWTDLSLQLAGSPLLPGSIGALDAQGSAQAQLVLPPLPPQLAGVQLHFSTVVLGALAISHATPPTRVSLIP